MLEKNADIEKRILTLLDYIHTPISVNDIAKYLGDSCDLVNLSLAQLLHQRDIEIKSMEGENYIVRAKREDLIIEFEYSESRYEGN